MNHSKTPKRLIMHCCLAICGAAGGLAQAASYDALVLRDDPVAYFPLSAPAGASYEPDYASGGADGVFHPRPARHRKTRLPNGDLATVFDGRDQYFEIASRPSLSIPVNGSFTLEAWVRPDTLEFRHQEGDNYVHWLGKGEPGRHEYVFRMYSLTTTSSPPRPNRTSAYVFNPTGGLGSGAYVQEPLRAGTWMHFAMVVETAGPWGGANEEAKVRIYKNGMLRQSTPLSQFGVTPQPGLAPLRVGTRDFRSYFQGAIGKVAVYNYALSASQLRARHVEMMRGAAHSLDSDHF